VNRRPTAGFTLIEVLMVVVVIGLIAGVAIPRLNVNQYRVDAGVRSVASMLTQAQRMAVTQQYNVNVLFVTDQNAIRMHEDADNDNVIDGDERVRQLPIGENVVFGQAGAPNRPNGPGPITFTRRLDGIPELIFRRDGSASENGTVYVTSLNADAAGRVKEARAVEVLRATGRISWYKYSGSAWIQRF
jgi:prepilin-type N-terminal cleavage/methylation domain-containing protein